MKNPTCTSYMGPGAPKNAGIGPTEPITLKEVAYAAKKYAIYTLKGVKRNQG